MTLLDLINSAAPPALVLGLIFFYCAAAQNRKYMAVKLGNLFVGLIFFCVGIVLTLNAFAPK